LLRALSASETVTVMDVGRLDPSSPAMELLAHADLTLVVARPTLAEIARLAARIAIVKERARRPEAVGLVLNGPGYPAAAVEDSQQTPVLITLPHNKACAGVLAGTLTMRRGLDRTPLARAARTLGRTIADHYSGRADASRGPARAEHDLKEAAA
jgi:hypothetical protein